MLMFHLGPFLLGYGTVSHEISVPSTDTPKARPSWKTIPPHRDEDQVKLDVDRSFIYYPTSKSPTLPSQIAPALAKKKN